VRSYSSPSDRLTIVFTLLNSFVAFISGAFAAVLVLLSVIDPVFLHFEITPDRSVLFYLGVFTSILAISRGMVPATNQVFDPELLLTEVVGYVHYMPETWEGRLHSHQVGFYRTKAFDFALTRATSGAR
jgi:autophagy-related protein 9